MNLLLDSMYSAFGLIQMMLIMDLVRILRLDLLYIIAMKHLLVYELLEQKTKVFNINFLYRMHQKNVIDLMFIMLETSQHTIVMTALLSQLNKQVLIKME